MTVELKPVGHACNLNCLYCYQHAVKGAAPRDLDAMLAAAELAKSRISLFGGEPMLTPIPVLEKIFQRGLELSKRYASKDRSPNSIQSNGVLITDEHIELFQRYSVSVGVSIDGPGELNGLRVDRDGVNHADEIIANIYRMRDAKISVSIISVLHELNETLLGEFKQFGLDMAEIGVVNFNIHFLQEKMGSEEYALSPDREARAFVELARWLEDNPPLRWQPFMDTHNLIAGKRQNVLCHWNSCDPLHTTAVYSIEPDGTVTGCSRLHQHGIAWLRADRHSNERGTILAQVDQEHGGCRGCRFFPLCTGGCPGEGLGGDWRNRSSHCTAIKALFRFYEDRALDAGEIPATVKPVAKCQPIQGGNVPHGDAPHGDRAHGDAPHGDSR